MRKTSILCSYAAFFLFSMIHSTLAAATDQPQGIEAINSFDLKEVFLACPIIYTLLIILSLASFIIWIYSMITLRLSEMMPKEFLENIRELLLEKRFDAAVTLCQEEGNFIANIIASGITARKHGAQVMIDSIQAEGRRAGNVLWQRISLLNEISIIAPMLGLLGTVVGLFFAFYDASHNADSIASIFDGFGIAVGTTVVGLVVAIISMIFYTTLKFRVVNLLNSIEYESLALVKIVDLDRSH